MSTIPLRTRRDPFFAEFDALMRSTLSPATGERLDFTPAAEAVRDGEDVLVRLDLPGLDPSDVSVEVVTGRLVVAGERTDTHTGDESDARSIREVRYGSFKRSFALPSHVGPADVSADYDRGVLAIRVSGVYAGTTPTRIAIGEAGHQA